jgi:phenylalanyl-tRNA synthetase alpha chain
VGLIISALLALKASRAGTFRNKGGTAVISIALFRGDFSFIVEVKMSELREMINSIKDEIKKIDNLNDLAELKASFLGKKGPIQIQMQRMRDLEEDERRSFGKEINEIKTEAEAIFEGKRLDIEAKKIQDKLDQDAIDVTLPGRKMHLGAKHLVSQIIEEFEDLFIGMGYTVEEGPEVELDKYNFEMLNLPKDHPARDMQDSFYITEELLLRTHTSPVQVRAMLKNKAKKPLKIICPGKVYRNDDDDPTHSHQFTQIEALVVDQNVTLADLKGTLLVIARKMFGEKRQIRLRPSFFPFTEPSVEVDVSCHRCEGIGCSLCKGTGWIEILGAGMVNNNVLKAAGYDPEVYQGFALGMGVERIAILKYEIDDIRNFFTNDLRFNKQF